MRHPVQESDPKAYLNAAIDSIEKGYKERIAALADEIHKLDAQIEQLSKDAALLEEEKAPQEERVTQLDQEITAETKFLERLTEQLVKKAEVTAELKQELDRVQEPGSTHLLHNRKLILKELQKEIEETEIQLIEKELERQNHLIEIEPKRQQIRALRMRINALQAQKRYIESSGMHRLSQPMLPTDTPAPSGTDDIIDTDISTT